MRDVEAEIAELTLRVAAAEKRKDVKVISSFIAKDYMGVDPSGQLIDRPALLARYRSEAFRIDTLELSDIVVRASDAAALEVGKMHLAGSLGEKRFYGRYRYSHHWVREGSEWLIRGSQMTPILEG